MTTWAQVAVIVVGYAFGLYFQNRRIDDLRTHVDKRFDDLYRYLEKTLGVKP